MITLSSIAESIFDAEFYWKAELKDTRYSTPEEEREKEILIIADWLEAHIGELNIMINTHFEAVDGAVDFHEEESAILREMYMMNYYRKQGRNMLRQLDGSTATATFSFKTIREGDSMITAPSMSENQAVARSYRLLMNDSRQAIEKLVHNYNMYRSKPNQVSGDDVN